MLSEIEAVDLFAGAGGTSSGLAEACLEMGVKIHLTAINHWLTAVESHKANHPWATHLCQRVEATDPTEVAPDGHLNLVVASPECTHYSVARGGKPIQDQKRASPWYILPWIQRLRVDSLLIENVPEFQSWGPLGVDGRPLKRQKRETFKAFIHAIEASDYSVSYDVLNAADYGDATSRKRLFILARRGKGRIIHWPRPTHSKGGKSKGTKTWRAAREVIDWSIEGQSIFTRKKPLADATMRRIIAGLEKFGGAELQPFLIVLRGTDDRQVQSSARSVDEPMPTFSANGNHVGVAEPFMLSMASGGAPRSVDEPAPTFVAKGGGFLVDPFILPPLGYHHRNGKANKPRSIEDPLQTITRRGGGHLVSAHIQSHFGERPGQEPRVRSVNEPMPTVTSREPALVEGVLIDYHGQSTAHSIEDPVPTLRAKDRLGLVQPVINGFKLDIRFRMLQPHELSAAMGFAPGYKFMGNRQEVVRQIGNAVAVNMAKALCLSLLRDQPVNVEDISEVA